MNAVPKFRERVLAIAAKHGIDLDKPGAYLRLEQEKHGSLVIENIGGSRVSVTNYIRVGDDCMADPEIVVYTGRERNGLSHEETRPDWYPIEMNQFFGGWQLCAELDCNGDLAVYDRQQQAGMARIIETTVASMLNSQDWLNNGILAREAVSARDPEEEWERDAQISELDDVPF